MSNLEVIVQYVTKLIKLARPVTHEVDGEPYAVRVDGTLGEHVYPPPPIRKPTLAVETLTGLVDAYKANIDSFPAKVALIVGNFKMVTLISLEADEFGRRHEFIRAVCGESEMFPFGTYLPPEQFLIALEAGFLTTENIVQLSKLSSSLSNENNIATADDGISQVVTVKQGTVTRVAVELPRRIPLIPWRSFREVPPVETQFLLRMKGNPGQLPTVGLLEIDGGKWKLDTIHAIGHWLRKALPDATVIA